MRVGVNVGVGLPAVGVDGAVVAVAAGVVGLTAVGGKVEVVEGTMVKVGVLVTVGTSVAVLVGSGGQVCS